MDMPMSSTPTAGTAPTGTMSMGMSATTSAAAMSMGGSGCKISMLWNWNTIDSCFISSDWKITSNGMFAGSCIGVILLVMTLELLRRAVKEYDRYLVRTHREKALVTSVPPAAAEGSISSKNGAISCAAPRAIPPFRPNILQQAVRALLHMSAFAVAYFIMLLAMYYNGYLIICIFIGSYIGSFIFHWETLTFADSSSPTSATSESTVCCG